MRDDTFERFVEQRTTIGAILSVVGYVATLGAGWFILDLIITPFLKLITPEVKGVAAILAVLLTVSYWLGWILRAVYRENIDTWAAKMGPKEKELYRLLLSDKPARYEDDGR